jgi:hypothetical protein
LENEDERANQDQRHPQGGASRNVVEHIDIKSFDARPIVDAMKKMSFTRRDTGRRRRDLQHDARRPGLLDILVIAGSTSAGGCMDLMPSLVRTTWSTRSSPPAPRSSTWISSKRLATSIIKRLKSLTTTRSARSTSTDLRHLYR